MRLLDLFCGAGCASAGYHRAGFDVVGVDINPQPNYPFEFVQADALDVLRFGFVDRVGAAEFAAVHASPPCQRYSTLKTVTSRETHDLIAATRELLETTGLPYVIENVPGAKRLLRDPVMICGTALGCWDTETELRRHRFFETNWGAVGTTCAHSASRRPVGVYGHLTFNDRPNRPVDGPTGPHGWKAGKARARSLMGVDWTVTDTELGEAIPPRYTYFIGRQLRDHLRGE